MIHSIILSLYILTVFCLAKFAHSTVITLDLAVKVSTDKVDVVTSEHYGLSSLEYYPKEGYTANKVIQGELFVWKGEGNDYCHNAILYSDSEPLSLLYLNVVVKNHNLYKYFVKVSGVWREVLEKAVEFFVNIDRTAYTPQQLDKISTEFLDNLPSEVEKVTFFYRNFFSFFIKPMYLCNLEISNPNSFYIMKQFYVGECFGLIYTPKTDYAISRVTYKGKQLWSKANDGKLCSSVWTYYKGDFDQLIVIRLDDLNDHSHSNTHICFTKNDNEISMITLEQFQKLYLKMKNADYDEKDIECYKDGYLKARDIAILLNPVLAICIGFFTVLYYI